MQTAWDELQILVFVLPQQPVWPSRTESNFGPSLKKTLLQVAFTKKLFGKKTYWSEDLRLIYDLNFC